MAAEEYRFKEKSMNESQLLSMKATISNLNFRLNEAIKNSNEIILLQNDPRFKKDFGMIIKKQEMFAKIKK